MRKAHTIFIYFILCISSAGYAREIKRIMRPRKESTYHKFCWEHPDGNCTPRPSLKGKQTGIVETPGIEPLGYKVNGNTKVFRLTAQPIKQTLTDGKQNHHKLLHAMKNLLGTKDTTTKQELAAWGYNGSTPGPTIELTVGDHVRVIFKNELPEPTLIHWHGIEHPHELDRSSDRNPVLPGETYIYEFTVHQAGTFMYHSGCSISKHNRSGLVGMIIVHPKKYAEPVDRHIALILQEWALSPKSSIPNTVAHQFNWFTVNGLAAPSIPIITLHEDERVRFHIGSMAINSYPLQLHGYTWTVVGTEGGPIQKSAQIKGATLTMDPHTTRTIEFNAWNPGTWPFYAINRHHCMGSPSEVPLDITPHGGMFTLVKVLKKDPKAPWAHPLATD